jgi:predicted transcriptional regulator
MATTVRISPESRERLREMADREHVPMQTVLDRAIEAYRRNRFLDAVNRQFDSLKANPEAWKDEQNERALWDNTLADDGR